VPSELICGFGNIVWMLGTVITDVDDVSVTVVVVVVAADVVPADPAVVLDAADPAAASTTGSLYR
jgi:hypothetical protein